MDKKIVKMTGLTSGALVIVFTVLSSLFFSIYMLKMPSEWIEMQTIIENFNHRLFDAWILNCLLLALSFPIFAYCIFCDGEDESRFFGGIGLIFSAIYCGILATNYFVLLNVVAPSITNKILNGIEWYVIGSPNSITYSIIGAGYGLMGLSMLFLSFSVKEKFAKIAFLSSGVGGVLGIISVMLKSNILTILTLGLWSIAFPVAIALKIFSFINFEDDSLKVEDSEDKLEEDVK